MYIKRAIEKTIKEIEKSFPVLLITGPRQVGKTTVLKQLADEGRRYVTLDDPMLRDLAKSDPALFLQRFNPPVIIDEIQYAPELFPYIKMHADESGRKGEYWLTGSQAFHLMKNVSESLAGRVGVISLLGLSDSEIYSVPSVPFTTASDILLKKSKQREPHGLNEVYQRIFKGSMPALHVGNANSEMFFSSYIQTYLQRDVKDLTQVGDELAFLRFLTSVAARTGQAVNYTDMAKDVGISTPTAKQWMSVLVASGMVYLLEPYFNNVLKRAIKTPKMYFLDTGLCAYLTRWTSPESMEAGAMSGAFFETYVVGEIVKSYLNAGLRPPIYYYRDKDDREIDLLIHADDFLYPVEIKKSANPGKASIRHFSALEKTGLAIGEGSVLCFTSQLIPIDNKNWYVPAWLV